ncbi:MAG TPA: uroporphyrinogen decarboxylase family protein [Acidobacteriota bacterium]|nr:uroporphyrinogen decarboxylase family protein [Acidobacteriota bacterium]
MLSSAERLRTTLSHQIPDRIPIDFGSTSVSGMHVSCVAALRDYYGLEKRPVKVIEPGQMLGEIDQGLKNLIGVDTEGVSRRNCRFGFPIADWKPWRTPQGLEVLVPGGFTTTTDDNGDILLYPQGDLSAPPSARMPQGGFFFDNIVRQPPIDEDRLNPEDNLEEFRLISDQDLDHLEKEVKRACATGRGVVASFGGTAFGDIGHVPAPGLKNPKGIRDVSEWYISIVTRPDYVRAVFEGQCEIALQNLQRIAARVGDQVDVVNICGTDFGTQSSSFCSVQTFRELWMPYYRRINDWIHQNTKWKTFKHSCGAVEKFIDSFIEAGFDILNPVQCSAAGMDPEDLKNRYGDRIVFWGGGVDTQQVLPFGTPRQVREQVFRRCETFSKGGGFVFNTIHNVQACTPVKNLVALIEAVQDFNGTGRW